MLPTRVFHIIEHCKRRSGDTFQNGSMQWIYGLHLSASLTVFEEKDEHDVAAFVRKRSGGTLIELQLTSYDASYGLHLSASMTVFEE